MNTRYSIRITAEAEFVRFTLTGLLDAETDVEIDRDIAAHCARVGARAALVDIRSMRERLSVPGNFVAASSYRQRLGDLQRVAIIETPEHHQRSEMFELSARNRGADVRFFTDPDAAEAWLRATAAPPPA